MKNFFFRSPQRSSKWALTGFVLGLVWLLGAARLQAVTVTTLGGGDPHVSPKYLGYRDGTTLSSALFHTPAGLAIDSTGSYLFVADRDNNAIRYLDLAAGLTWTFGVVNTNLVNKPVGVVVDTSLNVTVLNRGGGNNGSVVTFDSFGDTVATNATGLTNACGITMDVAGNFYVTVRSNTVIKITPAGVRTNVVTIPMAGTSLQGIVAKHNGMLAACDAGRNGIYLINPLTGLVTTNAGFHGRGDFPTNGNNVASSSTAKFFQPTGIAEAGDGTLIVTDYGNNRVKVVLASGVVTNLYGVVSNFWGGTYKGWYDGSVVVPDFLAPNVQSRIPFGVAFAPDGSVYTSEDYYHLIRKTTGGGFALPPPPPPTAPTIQSVVTNYGQVTLVWSAVANAASYNVKRSLSSNQGFLTITNTTATTFTDTSVSNGVAYYYVVSALNATVEGPNSLQVRAVPPVPPPTSPTIGWYDYEGTIQNGFFTVLHPVSGINAYIANNDLKLAINPATSSGASTYYLSGPATNLSTASDTSITNGSTAPYYKDGLLFSQPPPVNPLNLTPTSDLMIKAINRDSLGQLSAVATAEFIFQVANPTVTGNNAAQFTISEITSNSACWYTLDGSVPSNAPPSFGPLIFTTNSTVTISLGFSPTNLQVRGFRAGYLPSGTITQVFATNNYHGDTITFGRPFGEPHSSFVTRPGQVFYAPVTLQVLPGLDTMYSLQFNVTVTNGLVNTNTSLRPPAIQNNALINFVSMLMTKVDPGEGLYFPPASGLWYLNIPPVRAFNFSSGTNYVGTTFVNTNNNLLGVGWIFRTGFAYLYADTFGKVFLDFDTGKQDLITFSIAHDTLFSKSDGVVMVGAYCFQVPTNASYGDQYFIQLGSPSATSDGVGAGVTIAAPSSAQSVTVGSPAYVAGDVAPFHWFNAGDFGDTNLDNSDVMQVYQAAIVGVDMPPTNSDFFAAMDSSGRMGAWDNVNQYYTDPGVFGNLPFANQQAMWDGNDLSINTNAFGDGVLDINDLFVTFRRSLDPSLIWFKRYWTNGQFVAVTTTNYAFNSNSPASFVSKASAQVSTKVLAKPDYRQSSVSFSAGDAVVSAGQTIQIPISANVFGGYPLRVLGLSLKVVPLDGSPALNQPVVFTPAPALGSPSISSSKGVSDYSAAWLNRSIAGLSGDSLIGTLKITIPANAASSSAYAVHFENASASPNGLAVFPKQTLTGLITLSSRTNSTYLDGVPDAWRLRWFGTVNNLLSLSNACASGDGVNNFKKFVAGVDPNVANNFPSVNAVTPVPAGATSAIHWPTVSGKQYAIERSPSLFPGAWSAIATNTGTGTDMEFDDNATGKSQFYRVRILP